MDLNINIIRLSLRFVNILKKLQSVVNESLFSYFLKMLYHPEFSNPSIQYYINIYFLAQHSESSNVQHQLSLRRTYCYERSTNEFVFFLQFLAYPDHFLKGCRRKRLALPPLIGNGLLQDDFIISSFNVCSGK